MDKSSRKRNFDVISHPLLRSKRGSMQQLSLDNSSKQPNEESNEMNYYEKSCREYIKESFVKWRPMDDLFLIMSMEKLNDLYVVHRTIEFSCEFSLEEITERWYQLLYMPSLSRTAQSAVRSLPFTFMQRFHKLKLWSVVENQLVSQFCSTDNPDIKTFSNLLNTNRLSFDISRTPKDLLNHWLLMKKYMMLSDQMGSDVSDFALKNCKLMSVLNTVPPSSVNLPFIENEINLELENLELWQKRIHTMLLELDEPLTMIGFNSDSIVAVIKTQNLSYLMRRSYVSIGFGESFDLDLNNVTYKNDHLKLNSSYTFKGENRKKSHQEDNFHDKTSFIEPTDETGASVFSNKNKLLDNIDEKSLLECTNEIESKDESNFIGLEIDNSIDTCDDLSANILIKPPNNTPIISPNEFITEKNECCGLFNDNVDENKANESINNINEENNLIDDNCDSIPIIKEITFNFDTNYKSNDNLSINVSPNIDLSIESLNLDDKHTITQNNNETIDLNKDKSLTCIDKDMISNQSNTENENILNKKNKVIRNDILVAEIRINPDNFDFIITNISPLPILVNNILIGQNTSIQIKDNYLINIGQIELHFIIPRINLVMTPTKPKLSHLNQYKRLMNENSNKNTNKLNKSLDLDKNNNFQDINNRLNEEKGS